MAYNRLDWMARFDIKRYKEVFQIKTAIRYLSIGLGLVLIAAAVSWATHNWVILNRTYNTVAVIALFGIIAFSGLMGRGDRLRTVYTREADEKEDETDRAIRKGLPLKVFLIGLPSFIMLLYSIIFNQQPR